MSREKQDDWKRTQIRIPIGIYEDITRYAEQKNLSINTAMLELMDKGLKPTKHFDLIEETVAISDQIVDKIADKVAEKLKKAP